MKVARKMSGSDRTDGFSLFELIVTISILALLAMVAIPTIARRMPGYERRQFAARVNSITRLAWSSSVATQKLHMVQFDLIKREVSVLEKSDQKDKNDRDHFKPLSASGIKSKYIWPKTIEPKQIFVNGEEEISKHGATRKDSMEIWFYVVPEGMAQAVIVNFVDLGSKRADDSYLEFGLVLNPFTVQFKEYDSFQVP